MSGVLGGATGARAVSEAGTQASGLEARAIGAADSVMMVSRSDARAGCEAQPLVLGRRGTIFARVGCSWGLPMLWGARRGG